MADDPARANAGKGRSDSVSKLVAGRYTRDADPEAVCQTQSGRWRGRIGGPWHASPIRAFLTHWTEVMMRTAVDDERGQGKSMTNTSGMTD